MSAITGIFYRDGRSVDPELIKCMNNKLSHRGPDGSHVWCEGPVALGHQMLFTTPESLHEKLPFYDKKADIVITSDARIDNRKELSQELEIENKENISDSYFILKAYQKWGENCPEKLLGDFAFAIWDKKNEKLFCARDHMGVKPFYYYLTDDEFFFATEIKALFTIPNVQYNLNEYKIALFLMGIDDYKSTFYENIYNFNPAHYLKIDYNKSEIINYWKLDPNSQITFDSEERYINAFREIFAESVQCRLRSAFRIGFELSGGMDSSSVVCMAKKLFNNGKSFPVTKINTFSLIYNNFPKVDERYYIKSVTDTGGFDPYFINSDKISPLENMESIFWYHEQPSLIPNIAILWKLYQKLLEKDIRVVLGGSGGDSIISHGANYVRDLAVDLKWPTMIREIKNYSKHVNIDFKKLFIGNVIYPLIPELLKQFLNPYSNRMPGSSILNKDFAKKTNAEKYLMDLYWDSISKANTAKKLHYHDIETGCRYLLEMHDKLASNFMIEHRYPFLDKRLVEFCYALPTDMKFKSGWSRYILRAAMTDILPIKNQWRTLKANLNPVYKKNLLLYEKNTLDEIIFSDNNLITDYVDIDEVKNHYKKLTDGISGYDSSYYIWLILQLMFWLKNERFIKE